jgi:uncharacterized protein (DUF1501 family)
MSGFISRRDLFRNGSLIAVGLMAPPWLSAIARADVLRTAKGRRIDPDTTLVVCQLTGGNDGLNTVVPYQDPLYYKNRPVLGLKEDRVLPIGEGLGLHHEMKGLAELYQKGQVAVIQGVGYPNPNRSHFKSMDIWQSASPEGKLTHGWIGRHFDLAMAGGPLSAVAGLGLSTDKPLALSAREASVPCFASLADIQNMVGDGDAERLLREIQGEKAEAGSTTRIIQQANETALDAMSELKKRLANVSQSQQYENDPFGRGFKQIAQIVAASPATRVVYFSTGGFDTHSRQAEQHAKLLKGFSDAVTSFMAEMEACGRADKVLVLVFSEFGRRVGENGSVGTDHGKAAPMFLIGKSVKGGLYGPKPDLTKLDDGDLAYAIDFRQVYATALDDWMGGDSMAVLGQKFETLPVLRA